MCLWLVSPLRLRLYVCVDIGVCLVQATPERSRGLQGDYLASHSDDTKEIGTYHRYQLYIVDVILRESTNQRAMPVAAAAHKRPTHGG